MPKSPPGSKRAAKKAPARVVPKRTGGIAKPPIRRLARNYTITRTQAYGFIRSVGKAFAASPGLKAKLPEISFVKAQRLGFLDRSVEDTTGKLLKSSAFGSRYRTTWGAQDELLSTASVRNLVTGLLDGRTRAKIPSAEWKLFRNLVDLLSALRIPTKYSGFSVKGEVMQHPTEVGEGFFSTKAVDGQHGTYDSARVKYVGDAVRLSQANGDSPVDQLRAAARAAIEFSLNYFTAPVTASNVQPYSTKKGVSITNQALLDQVASREAIKELYVKFGGNLRELGAEDDEEEEETGDESLSRVWQRDLPITKADPFPFAPPSPRRERRKPEKAKASSSAVTVTGGAKGATSTGAPPFSTTTSLASPSSVKSPANTKSPFGAKSSPGPKSQALGTGPVFVGMVLVPPLPLPVPMPRPTKSKSLLEDVLTGIAVGVTNVKKRARDEEDAMGALIDKRVRTDDSASEDPGELRLGIDGAQDGDASSLEEMVDDDSLGILSRATSPMLDDDPLMRDLDEMYGSPSEEDMEQILSPDGASSMRDELSEADFPSVPTDEPFDADAFLARFPSVPTEEPFDADAFLARFPSVPTEEPFDADAFLAQFPSVPTDPPMQADALQEPLAFVETDTPMDVDALMAQFPKIPTEDPMDVDAFMAQFPSVPTHVPGMEDIADPVGGGVDVAAEGVAEVGASSAADALAVLLV